MMVMEVMIWERLVSTQLLSSCCCCQDVVVIAGAFSATFGHHLTHRLPDGQKRFVEITLFPWKLRPFVPFPGNDTA